MQKKSFWDNLFTGIVKRSSKLLHNPYSKLNISSAKLKYLKHLPTGPIRKHQMLDGTVYFTSPQELLHGLNEIFVQEVYKLQLPENPYILDCGANIGLSVIYLKHHYPSAIIEAFEPDEKNFELLTRNIEAFNYKNIHLHKEAVWNENTFISFSNDGSMSSKIDAAGKAKNQIKATRLKDHLNKKVDFLKIDIEGAEYAVLTDIKDLLFNVQNMFIEYHGSFAQNDELIDIFNIIRKAGFSFYIKEATSVYDKPFTDAKMKLAKIYDVQLNIFCFRLDN